jgi:hypothetical protein
MRHLAEHLPVLNRTIASIKPTTSNKSTRCKQSTFQELTKQVIGFTVLQVLPYLFSVIKNQMILMIVKSLCIFSSQPHIIPVHECLKTYTP